jgi:hypothetical protein
MDMLKMRFAATYSSGNRGAPWHAGAPHAGARPWKQRPPDCVCDKQHSLEAETGRGAHFRARV